MAIDNDIGAGIACGLPKSIEAEAEVPVNQYQERPHMAYNFVAHNIGESDGIYVTD